MEEEKLPTTTEELLSLSKKYTELPSGERFLQQEDAENNGRVALIFASEFGKRILKESSEWAMDGTFETVPTSFSQLYVVFGSGGQPSEKIYPAAYMLLPDKNSNTYKHAFQTLGNMTGAKPSSVSMDFEQSAISALKSVFPDVVIKGCAFHFKQSLRKNLGTKGCLKLYKQDENFQVGMQLVYTLMYVPPEDVGLAWEEVVEAFFEDNFADVPEVQDYLSYVENTFIGKVNGRSGMRKNPRFSIISWSSYERIMNGQPTTNNSVESWNGKWNKTHPDNHNVLRLITGFQKEDSFARTKFYEIVAGKYTDPNPGRTDMRERRKFQLAKALTGYNSANLKEFLFGLREDV